MVTEPLLHNPAQLTSLARQLHSTEKGKRMMKTNIDFNTKIRNTLFAMTKSNVELSIAYYSILKLGYGIIYSSLATSLVNILYTNEKANIAYDALVQFGKCAKWNEFPYITAIQYLAKRKNVASALTVYNLYTTERQKRNIAQTDIMSNTMLNLFINNQEYNAASRIYDELSSNTSINVHLRTSAIKMFLAMKDFDQALQLWNHSDHTPNVVGFTVMISGLVDGGMLIQAQQVYQQFLKLGLAYTIELHNTIIKMFVTMGDFDSAIRMIDKNGVKSDIVTYGIIINGLLDAYEYDRAREIYNSIKLPITVQVQAVFVKLHIVTGDIDQARKIWKNDNNLQTYNTILNACLDCGRLDLAEEFYSKFTKTQNNTMLMTTVLKMKMQRDHKKGIKYLHDMTKIGIFSNSVTLIMLLDFVSDVNDQWLFDAVLRYMDEFSISPTVDLYNMIMSKHFAMHEPEKAHALFETMTVQPNIHTYRILVSDFSSQLFVNKLLESLNNKQTKTDLEKCVYIMCMGQQTKIDELISEFETSTKVDLWYSMFYACMLNGKGNAAIKLLDQMIRQQITPTVQCFEMVLLSCSFESNIKEAERVYQIAKLYGFGNRLNHTMIDVYARNNYLDQAEALAKQTMRKKQVAWMTMLAGCKKYGDIIRMKQILKEQLFLANQSASLLVMRNIANASGDNETSEMLSNMWDERQFKKIPGMSCVMVNNELVTFVVDDIKVKKEAIDLIDNLVSIFGTLYGYVPDISCVLKKYHTHEDKVHSLMRHSEKLATATALLAQPGTQDIVVSKNLRICIDCHTFAKHLSKYYKRRFIISDKAFKHVFYDGKCTCNDKY
jgi:pentatricopeptide repeat protein